ncbi:MAG: carboxypeptidase regulatory-like domain-containing protein [Candidatus Neomarinimicrobiota bacterium]|nr:MAG: carboxypeptidase regulatory-like domain-containing protein [Candidatus Neomarinimicrobiota bacterium]
MVEAYMKRTVFLLITACWFLAVSYAQDYVISGSVVDVNGEKATDVVVLLLNKEGAEVQRAVTKSGMFGKGSFEFEKVLPGEYTIQIDAAEAGVASVPVTVIKTDVTDINIKLSPKPAEPKVTEQAPENPVPQEEQVTKDKDYIINELSFEVKKMASEIKNLNSELEDLKALSKMWVNPLSIYSKEIILKNGSTVFGKIVFQDEKSLKVETLVGYLIIDRDNVVRIVDNVVTEEQQEYVPEQIRDSYSPPPMPKLAEPKYTSTNPAERQADKKISANCVLVGNIKENKDKQGNIIFSGEVKNIGGRRADFVKIDFVFRKNWSGETKTLTTFVRGTYQTFESGITTDASLLPGAVGTFELYVPHSFGNFIGYSYVIDWEEYE